MKLKDQPEGYKMKYADGNTCKIIAYLSLDKD